MVVMEAPVVMDGQPLPRIVVPVELVLAVLLMVITEMMLILVVMHSQKMV